ADSIIQPSTTTHSRVCSCRRWPLRLAWRFQDQRDRQESPSNRETTMTEDTAPSGAQRLLGDFAPALVGYTDDVLFGDVWKRTELTPKERSLVTIAALTTMGNTDQLVFHLDFAKQNGNTQAELIEAITHLAFYAGWPKAMAAMTVAKRVFRGDTN